MKVTVKKYKGFIVVREPVGRGYEWHAYNDEVVLYGDTEGIIKGKINGYLDTGNMFNGHKWKPDRAVLEKVEPTNDIFPAITRVTVYVYTEYVDYEAKGRFALVRPVGSDKKPIWVSTLFLDEEID